MDKLTQNQRQAVFQWAEIRRSEPTERWPNGPIDIESAHGVLSIETLRDVERVFGQQGLRFVTAG